MKKRITLLIDAAINLVLGILLLAFSPGLAHFLGIPPAQDSFYPNILGAVLTGIALALVLEAFRKERGNHAGLGTTGAICINLCGGIVLFFWLVSGNLDLPLKGKILLWTLDIILLVISLIELSLTLRNKK
jgi:hypothetical protein